MLVWASDVSLVWLIITFKKSPAALCLDTTLPLTSCPSSDLMVWFLLDIVSCNTCYACVITEQSTVTTSNQAGETSERWSRDKRPPQLTLVSEQGVWILMPNFGFFSLSVRGRWKRENHFYLIYSWVFEWRSTNGTWIRTVWDVVLV